MNLLQVPSLITITGPNGEQQPTSINEYLRTLISANSIATFMSHKVEMYGKVEENGSIKVKIPRFFQATKYNALGGNKTQQAKMTYVMVSIDKESMIKTSIDKFDLMRFKESGAYQAEVIGSIAKTIILDLNAHFYLKAMEIIQANKQNAIQLDFSKQAESLEEMAQAKLTNYKYVQFINQSKKVFTTLNYSLETSDIITVLDTIGATNVTFGFTTGSAGDKAIDIQVEGYNTVAKQLGGLNYITDEAVINNIHPMGSSFSADEEFDFSNATAFSIYSGAIAMPFVILEAISTYDPDTLNPIIGSKYMYGIEAVLPQFIWGAFKDVSHFVPNLEGSKLNLVGVSTNPSTLKVVATPTNLKLSDMGTITATSSDESVATVAYANGIVTVTKVSEGSTTIKVSSNNSKVNSGEKEVIFA